MDVNTFLDLIATFAILCKVWYDNERSDYQRCPELHGTCLQDG